MLRARESSAGVWDQPGVYVGRSMGCLSIPEHPRTAPLRQAETSAPGTPAQLKRRISSQRLHPSQAFPRRASFQGQMLSTLGWHLQAALIPQDSAHSGPAGPSPSLLESGSIAGHDPSTELVITLPVPLLPGRAGPRNMPTKSEGACQIRPQDCLPLSLPLTCAFHAPLTTLQCCAQCQGSLLQV